MPKTISHFVVVLDKDGNMPAPFLLRAVPMEHADDDDLERTTLMGMLASTALGPAFPLTRPDQIWAFWEMFALPSGFHLQTFEAVEYVPAASSPPAPPVPEEPMIVPPTVADVGHA